LSGVTKTNQNNRRSAPMKKYQGGHNGNFTP
jgi:hypothetical protein